MDGPTGRVRWLPLAGFEADTAFRALSLRVWNGLNRFIARRIQRPLRISIHPGDLDLLLKMDAKRMLEAPWRYVGEEEASGNETGLQGGDAGPAGGDAGPAAQYGGPPGSAGEVRL